MTTFPVALPGAQASTLMWADPAHVEPAALEQLRSISRLPWVHGLRVMPDVHLGKGATVGSVIAMRDAVSPAAVGVDIGCGMTGVRTNLTAADLPGRPRPAAVGDRGRSAGRLARARRHGPGAGARPGFARRFDGLDGRASAQLARAAGR